MLSAFCYTVQSIYKLVGKIYKKIKRKFTSLIRIDRKREWGWRVKWKHETESPHWFIPERKKSGSSEVDR
jgi:hypothetical protein